MGALPPGCGFKSHLLHASDADQAKELLMAWSVEGVGKLPGLFSLLPLPSFPSLSPPPPPHFRPLGS